jgi:hypothetical protein
MILIMFTVRQVKNLRVREFSQTILNSIHDNSRYMEANVKGILQIEPYNGESYPTPILIAYQPGASP